MLKNKYLTRFQKAEQQYLLQMADDKKNIDKLKEKIVRYEEEREHINEMSTRILGWVNRRRERDVSLEMNLN